MTSSQIARAPDSEARESLLTVRMPMMIENPHARVMLTAAYLLEYLAKRGKILEYRGVTDGLLEAAKLTSQASEYRLDD